jgi:hypothetical protein
MITLDHNFTAQLWDNPLFWELVDWAEPYREEAEELLATVAQEKSTLRLAKEPLYNQWQEDLARRAKEQPESLQPLIAYIQKHRRQKERIQLRTRAGLIVIWDGE